MHHSDIFSNFSFQFASYKWCIYKHMQYNVWIKYLKKKRKQNKANSLLIPSHTHTVKTQCSIKPDYDVKLKVVIFAQSQIYIYWFFYTSPSRTEFTTVKSSIKYNTVISLIVQIIYIFISIFSDNLYISYIRYKEQSA